MYMRVRYYRRVRGVSVVAATSTRRKRQAAAAVPTVISDDDDEAVVEVAPPAVYECCICFLDIQCLSEGNTAAGKEGRLVSYEEVTSCAQCCKCFHTECQQVVTPGVINIATHHLLSFY